jgi:hypothetical protein
MSRCASRVEERASAQRSGFTEGSLSDHLDREEAYIVFDALTYVSLIMEVPDIVAASTGRRKADTSPAAFTLPW